MIINSLLDTDLYKFTMMQVVLHHFPEAQVEYRFRCRTPNVDLSPYIAEIESEIHAIRTRLPAQLALFQKRLCRPAGVVQPRRAVHRRIARRRYGRRDRDLDQ